MRKGVYSTANLRRMRLVPYGYRCDACGALNDGFYPLAVTTSARDQAEEDLNREGRELTDAEHTARNRQLVGASVDEVNAQIAARRWGGSPNAVSVCGACGRKAPWGRPSMRARDWIVTMFIPLGIGVYELAYEGFFLHDPRAVLFGLIVTVLAAGVMAAAAAALAVRKRRIDRLDREARPTLFGEPEDLQAWLNEHRRDGEPLFRAIDPRNPEAGFLAAENEAARAQPTAGAWVLCKSCLRTLTEDGSRVYEGRAYCPDCYGIVRQQAETRSYLNLHKKRGGDIR